MYIMMFFALLFLSLCMFESIVCIWKVRSLYNYKHAMSTAALSILFITEDI